MAGFSLAAANSLASPSTLKSRINGNILCAKFGHSSAYPSRCSLAGRVSGSGKTARHIPTVVCFAAASTATNSDGRRSAFNTSFKSGPQWKDHPGFPLRETMLESPSAATFLTLLAAHQPEMTADDVAVAWHVAVRRRFLRQRADDSAPTLLKYLVRLADEQLGAMCPSTLSTLAWALASSETDETTELMYGAMTRAEHQLLEFQPGELGLLLWGAATHPGLAQDRRISPFHAFARLVEQGMVLSLFSAHDLSVLMWTLGVVGYLHADVVAAVQDQVIKKVDDIEPSDVARLLHGFATLRHNPVGMFHSLIQRATETMPEYSAEDITLLLISIAKLGVDPGTPFLKALDRRIGAMVPKIKRKSKAKKGSPRSHRDSNDGVENVAEVCLNPHQIGHIMWAFGILEHRPVEGKFMNAALRHLEECVEEYLPEEITTILWACTRLKTDPPPQVLVTITRRLQQILPTKLNDDDCSLGLFTKALSCLATLVIRQPSLLPTDATLINGFALKLGAVCVVPSNLRQLKASDLSSLVIALANLEPGPLPVQVSERLQEACAAATEYMQPSLIPRVAWAGVRLRWSSYPGRVWDALAVVATERCCLMPAESLVQLAWSFAALDRPYPELGRVLVERSLWQLPSLGPRDKARLAWAFAQMSRLWHVDKATVLQVVRSLSANEAKKLDPDSVSAVIWACGRLEGPSSPGSVLEALAANMAASLRSFSREQLTQARVILAKLGCRDTVALEAIGRELDERE